MFCDLYSVSAQVPFHLSLPHELSSSDVVRSTLSKIINKHTEHRDIFQGTAYTALKGQKIYEDNIVCEIQVADIVLYCA